MSNMTKWNLLFLVFFLLSFNLTFLNSFKIINNAKYLDHNRVIQSQRSYLQKSNIYMGYLPPEQDPEYKDIIKPSLLKPFQKIAIDDIEAVLPEPKPGDVVSYAGKWQDELQLGRIRALNYREEKKDWYADIVPLCEGKSDGIYLVDRDGVAAFEPISSLKPVRSFYVRSENGWRIAFKSKIMTNNDNNDSSSSSNVNTLDKTVSDLILRGPRYREVDENYVVVTKKIDVDVLKKDMEDYDALKNRLIVNSLLFGGVGALFTTGMYGLDVSIPYTTGVIAGSAYLFLLGKKTDNIGAGMAAQGQELIGNVNVNVNNNVNVNTNKDVDVSGIATAAAAGGAGDIKSKLEKYIVGGRYLVPVLAMGLLGSARKAGIIGIENDGFTTAPLRLLSKQEFLGAAAGFITYMVALIITEVGGEIQLEDWLSILPGSIAEGVRRSRGLQTKAEAEAEAIANAPRALVPLVVVSGPQAAGRGNTVKKLMKLADNEYISLHNQDDQVKEDTISTSRIQLVRFLTTDSSIVAAEPNKYELISKTEVDVLRSQNGTLIYEGTETGLFGKSIDVFLTLSSVGISVVSESDESVSAKDKVGVDGVETANTADHHNNRLDGVGVLECSPQVLDALSKQSSLRLINVWISLDNKQQFIDKASQIVKTGIQEGMASGTDKTELAKISADEVSGLVSDAARDITYYMQKAPLFELTLLNSVSDDETAAELFVLLKNIL